MEQPEISDLLRNLNCGDPADWDRLAPLVYRELHRQAALCMKKEGGPHLLQTTALIHECYLRLHGSGLAFENQRQFFAMAAHVMRQVLVECARKREALRRGGGQEPAHLHPLQVGSPMDPVDVLALHEALEQLARIRPRQSRIVELRFFVGLSNEDIADCLEIGLNTVKRDWEVARTWLYSRLAVRQ